MTQGWMRTDGIADGGIGGVHQRRFGGDGDRSRYGTNLFEIQIHRCRRVHHELNFDGDIGEAGRFGCDSIGSRLHLGNGIAALGVGDRTALSASVVIDQHNRRGRDDCAAWVFGGSGYRR
jgi:hypothetical protein